MSQVRSLPRLAPDEEAFVERAVGVLERPGFVVRLANLVGMPVETVVRHLPFGADRVVAAAGDRALRTALGVAIRTLPSTVTEAHGAERRLADIERAGRVGRVRHAVTAGAAGAVGGAFGWPGLLVELPVTTSLVLRSIGSIAVSFGEDLSDSRARLECLTVFAHGRPVVDDDSLDSSYFALRGALTEAVSQSSRFVAQAGARELSKAIERGGAPALLRLMATISGRFNLVVSEKLAASALPLIGAAGGAAVNAAFCDHFNTVARHHFGLRRLERRHGTVVVRDAYHERLAELADAGPASGGSRPVRAALPASLTHHALGSDEPRTG